MVITTRTQFCVKNIERWLLVFLIYDFAILLHAEDCTTPDNKPGNCIKIQQCESITTLMIQAPKPLSAELVELLRNYQCEASGTGVNVCCPNQPIVPVNPTSGSQSEFAKHRHFNLLPTECGDIIPTDRATESGYPSQLLEFPWLALLSYQEGIMQNFRCGGALINDRYILTAAHCVSNLGDIKLTSVRLGEHDITAQTDCEVTFVDATCAVPEQDVPLQKVLPHPNFNPDTFANDVALVRLARAINLGEREVHGPVNLTFVNIPHTVKDVVLLEAIKPICLPLKEYNLTEHSLVAGWSSCATGPRSLVPIAGSRIIVPIENCEKKFQGENITIDFTNKICVDSLEGVNNSCEGDDGGPFHTIAYYNSDIQYVHHGILAYGADNCGKDGFPRVYTNVANYVNWILDNIEP